MDQEALYLVDQVVDQVPPLYQEVHQSLKPHVQSQHQVLMMVHTSAQDPDQVNSVVQAPNFQEQKPTFHPTTDQTKTTANR